MVTRDVIWIYPVHNRLYYNTITFPMVLHEAMTSKRFKHLYVIDDNSEDGTTEFIHSLNANKLLDGNYTFTKQTIGSSTKQWNMGAKLQEKIGGKYLLDICNDLFFTVGLIDELADILDKRPNSFIVSPRVKKNQAVDNMTTDWPYISKTRIVDEANHVGCGLLRIEHYKKMGPITPGTAPGEGRYFGFTAYQQRMAAEFGHTALIAKHLKVVDLNAYPAYSRLEQYAKLGWSRHIMGKVEGAQQYWKYKKETE